MELDIKIEIVLLEHEEIVHFVKSSFIIRNKKIKAHFNT